MMDLTKFPQGFHGKHGKGLIPCSHDRSKDLSVRGLIGGTVRLAQSASLEQYVAAVYNQLNTSSCVGWALAQSIAIRCAAMGTPIGLPSPVALYTLARAIGRQASGHTIEQVPMTDGGCDMTMALQGANQWGVASSAVWPFDPATINDEPELDQLEAASAFKLMGYYAASETPAQRIVDVKQAISSGYPVFIGTAVDEPFEAYSGGRNAQGVPNCVTAPVASEILGGHGMCLIGYQQFGNLTLYRGLNQWGTGWGDSGLYWADESFVTNPYLTDCFVITVHASGN